MEEIRSSRTNIFCVENRKKANFSGIVDVISFNDSAIVLMSDLGEITVKGNDLKVVSFSNETGDIELIGKINIVGYTDDKRAETNFVKRLLR